MKKSHLLSAVCAIVLSVVTLPSHAVLVERLGGLAYYDDVADLTWLADANAGGVRMSWLNANNWAASLSVGGVGGWRLPDTAQPDSTCNAQRDFIGGDGVIDTSYGFNCTGSEMGNLFYNVLGGVAGSTLSTTGNANYDLFSNVLTTYWSATEYAPLSPTHAQTFNIGNPQGGGQGNSNKDLPYYAWAVQSGDVAALATPVPAAVWLFGSGLLGLVGMARRKKT
jgi:hypothetical protein